jgi:hypothetical protein
VRTGFTKKKNMNLLFFLIIFIAPPIKLTATYNQNIAMVNIHDLADKKVSLSFNVFVFFFFFIAVKPNWHHQTDFGDPI